MIKNKLNQLKQRLLTTAITGLAAVSLVSCSSTAPVQRDYFVLSPSQTAQTATISGVPKASVSRVTLPAYLNQQNLVRQVSADKVALLTQQLWAEKLSTAIPAIIAAELAANLGQPIETHPLPPGIRIDTRIEVHIRQFIATEQQLTLQADYRIVNAPTLRSYRFVTQLPLSDSRTQTLVNAYNTGLYQLAGDIAKHL